MLLQLESNARGDAREIRHSGTVDRGNDPGLMPFSQIVAINSPQDSDLLCPENMIIAAFADKVSMLAAQRGLTLIPMLVRKVRKNGHHRAGRL